MTLSLRLVNTSRHRQQSRKFLNLALSSIRQRRNLVSAEHLQFGQPLHETHPHILRSGELTPGITALEYAERRTKLAARLPPNTAVILSASDLKYRSGAVFYKFHQDADFLYLTGFQEPEALAVIRKHDNEVEPTFHLYVRPKDATAESWEGPRSGLQAAQDVFNADEVGDIATVPKLLPEVLKDVRHVFTDLALTMPDQSTAFNGKYLGGLAHWKINELPKIINESKRLISHPLRKTMNELRVIKSEAEIANMLRAGEASGEAFNSAMTHQFTREADLQASLEYHIRKNGCEDMAYVPVVGKGRNALSIHYVRNDDAFDGTDTVLVDAGGQYGGYITDITRTWPAGRRGTWTHAQRDLYEAVLGPQKTLVSKCTADGALSLDELHREAESLLKANLKSLGFDVSGNAMSELFPHHVSHHIGLDVHDAPGYPRREQLVAGNCITIEPGVYVSDSERWPKHFRNMGIRIEDSVCVREDRAQVLTAAAAKEVRDIEKLAL